jgi:hypothetical protein
MNQMKLITDSRDEWTVKELVETLHAKVDNLEQKLDAQLKLNDSIQWHLHAIVLHLTGDRAALTAFAMASKPTVVPNEDEAMPVLASCPCCEHKEATTAVRVEELFGYRTMANGKTIVQSWCRECRTDGKDKTKVMPVVEPVIVQDEPSPRKNVRLRMPPEVRALSQGATNLAREGQALIKQAMDNATANSGRMSLDDKKLLDAGTVKMTEAKRLQSEYNSKRERITYPNGRK